MATPPRNPKGLSHLPSPSKTLLSKRAMQDYVYFSDNTKGHTGKVVKIKVDLFTRFAALVDPKSHQGQIVIRQIENLRMANGATSGVHANINSAFRFMLKVGNIQIFYAVLDGESQGRKEIFIGDVKAQFETSHVKAGLHVFDTFTNKYNTYDKQSNLDGKVVYLNGQCESFKDALDNAHSRVSISSSNLALFYIPGKVVNELGVWNSSTVTQHIQACVSRLRDVIRFNSDKKVGWVAEAEGAEIFSNALDEIKGNLPGHKFRLIDPLTNTPALLQKLKSKEVKPTSDEVAPVTYTGQNRATTIFLEAQKQSVLAALKILRVKGYAEDPHLDTVATLESQLGETPVSKNKKSLIDTAALNKRVVHPKGPAVVPNKAALSFVAALLRI